MIAGALPIAAALSLGSFITGALFPSFALAYLVGAHLLANLALCALSFSLFGLRDRRGRWLSLTLAFTGLVGALGSLWLIGETLILGLPTVFPTVFLIIDSLGNAILIVGLAAVSVGQHRRSRARPVGYLLLSLLLLACIFVIYQANLVDNPPVLLALGLGGRIVLSFFSAVFALSLFFSQRPPLEIVRPSTRAVLVAALVLQLLARTLFALQCTETHTALSSFFLVGSPSDVLILFAECVLLTGGLAFFTQILEVMPAARPATIKYGVASRTLWLTTLAAAVLVTATTALALVSRVLPVFLSQADTMLALHTIAGGLVLGVVIVLLTVGVVASAMAHLMARPMQELSGEIDEVSQRGLTSYQEPRNLVFAELQSVSDGYHQLLEALRRSRSQLRAPDPFAHREAGKQAEAPAADFYSAVLEYQVSTTSEMIQRSAEALAHTVDDKAETNRRLKDVIAATEQLQEVLRVLQSLRQVEAGEIPEVSSKDLGNILRQVVEETKERYAQRALRISLQLSEPHPRVLANDLLTDIFTSVLRSIVRNDANEEVVIDVAVSQVQEVEIAYWQTVITSHGWIVPDEQKDTMFQRDARQAHTATPSLLLAKALTEALHGAFRTGNEVPYDQRYGTAFAVLLPAVMQDQTSKLGMRRIESRRPET
jgi:hypothetical protein